MSFIIVIYTYRETTNLPEALAEGTARRAAMEWWKPREL